MRLMRVFLAGLLAAGLALGLAACGDDAAAPPEPEAASLNLQNFVAILNIMPGAEPNFYVTGEVEVQAGNYDARLVKRAEENAPPNVLTLDIEIEQTGDMGTQALTWRLVRYDEPAAGTGNPPYTEVELFYEDELVERIPNVTVAQ